MKLDWVENQITEINEWLKHNEKQAVLPTMDIEDALHKQEVKHKKEMREVLVRIRHTPIAEKSNKVKTF